MTFEWDSILNYKWSLKCEFVAQWCTTHKSILPRNTAPYFKYTGRTKHTVFSHLGQMLHGEDLLALLWFSFKETFLGGRRAGQRNKGSFYRNVLKPFVCTPLIRFSLYSCILLYQYTYMTYQCIHPYSNLLFYGYNVSFLIPPPARLRPAGGGYCYGLSIIKSLLTRCL